VQDKRRVTMHVLVTFPFQFLSPFDNFNFRDNKSLFCLGWPANVKRSSKSTLVQNGESPESIMGFRCSS
jgi:hypothetical protein